MNKDVKSISPSKGPYPDWHTYIKIDDEYRVLDGDGLKQLIVYRKRVSDARFSQWLGEIREEARLKKGTTEMQIVSMCGHCDNSLLLLIGSAIETFISTEAARSNNPGPTPGMQGESNAAYYSSNLKIKLPDELLSPLKANDHHHTHDGPSRTPVKVAVFDTGLVRDEVERFLTPINSNPCIRTASQGWNFTEPSNNWHDDNPGQHGSNVTRFIIEQVIHRNGHSVEIIPVKIHNKEGKSDLFSILCGFAYARNMGAKIINASFGYYAPLRASAATSAGFGLTLFRRFIKDQLTNNKILLVAAAGNLPSPSEIAQIKQAHPRLMIETRDLGKVGFYPASFGRTLKNVIAVTSVDPKCNFVSWTQNFSRCVVDIGVQSDDPSNCHFTNPRTGASIGGSSFATPIATGLIASNYSLFVNDLRKRNIIRVLKQLSTLPNLEVRKSLRRDIRGGVVLRRY